MGNYFQTKPVDKVLADKMLADLIQGPFKGRKIKFHHTDPATGKREVKEIGE
ncbi:hypothetical protein [Emcibacter sp.]|uniref:hypothetical protein n=1 Tax=Emcibacter sp. TaxID=1979954 RepID=UPI002AA7B608|nr:hypothetical protein [Emcibacter sp.]